MYSLVDADYYGFRDDDDGVLEKVEAVAELELRKGDGVGVGKKRKYLSGRARDGKKRRVGSEEEEEKERTNKQEDKEDDEEEEGDEVDDGVESLDEEELEEYVAHVVVPTQKETEEALLEKMKAALTKAYVSVN